MLPFSTEFPVKKIEHTSKFVAEVVAWLRGNTNSTVLNDASARELDGENAQFLAESGEGLLLRELKLDSDWKAVGFRHELPDGLGRLWRTEAVLTRNSASNSDDIVRLRTQCIANQPGATLQIPKKPYLIKALLRAGWGGSDGQFAISDTPIVLPDSSDSLDKASAIMDGSATSWLPVVYISSVSYEEWRLTWKQIQSLAYQLGGIAHVVLERDRLLSLRLKDKCNGINPYGGGIGISLPKNGLIFRRPSTWKSGNNQDVLDTVIEFATNLRSQMPSFGWDWSELQEKTLRQFRSTYRGALTAQDADTLLDDYLKQISDIQEENNNLKELLSAASISPDYRENSFELDSFSRKIGLELYHGEVSDRLRLASRIALDRADAIGLDSRSRHIFETIMSNTPRSLELDTLLSNIAQASKDAKKACKELTRLLSRHGYYLKSDNKHVRLEPLEGFHGLASMTLPKTPSEYRGLNNLREQIEKILGINNLP